MIAPLSAVAAPGSRAAPSPGIGPASSQSRPSEAASDASTADALAFCSLSGGLVGLTQLATGLLQCVRVDVDLGVPGGREIALLVGIAGSVPADQPLAVRAEGAYLCTARVRDGGRAYVDYPGVGGGTRRAV